MSKWYVGFVMPVIASTVATAATPSINLKLAWDRPCERAEGLVALGYEVVITEEGRPMRTLFVPEAESPGGACSITLSNMDQASTYSFKCCTIYESTDLPPTRTNSMFTQPLVFKTGRVVAGDVTPPVVTCDASPFVTSARTAVLSGTVIDDSHLSLQVHGEFQLSGLAYDGAGGRWTARVELKALTPTPISIEARDLAGNTTTITNEIFYVAPPPAPVPHRLAPRRYRPSPNAPSPNTQRQREAPLPREGGNGI